MRCARRSAPPRQAGDHAELATLTSNLALVEGNLGRVEQALGHARRARSLNDPLGIAAGPPAGAIELYVSVHEGALGHYAESLAGFERARACFAGNPGTVWGGLTANHLAHVLTHLASSARPPGAAVGGRGDARHRGPPHVGGAPDRPPARAQERALDRRGARAARRPRHAPAAAPHDRISLSLPADEAAARCATVCAEAERMELLGIGLRARLVGLRHRVEAVDLLASRSPTSSPDSTAAIRPTLTWPTRGGWRFAHSIHSARRRPPMPHCGRGTRGSPSGRGAMCPTRSTPRFSIATRSTAI